MEACGTAHHWGRQALARGHEVRLLPAQYVRPYATDSQRTIALRKIAAHFEHRLFLSATPHNGYTESFTALLELLDPQRFARGVKPSEEAQRRILVRRLKSELRKELPPRDDGTPRFPERRIVPLRIKYPDSERQIHDALQEYTALRRKRAGSKSSKTAADFVMLLLKKRLFSSPKAFLETLREHMRTLNRRGAAEHVSESRLRAEFDRLEEDVDADDALDERTQDALSTAARASDPVSKEEEGLLARMLDWAEREAHRPDAKAKALLDWLTKSCRPDGTWNDERAIIFTEYRDTQRWLQDLLVRYGFEAERIALLYGGLETDKRERIKAEFQAPPDRSPVRILLATDAASEGIDLQLQCHRTDHCLYGVDRNPMALEMAKLSLWLTTMAKERPFTFLDHQVRSGDSLLGVTSLDQVRWVHIDPERGRKLWANKPLFTDPREAVDARVTDALDRARALAAIDVISLEDVERKSRLHTEMLDVLAPLGILADAVVGAALAEAGGEGRVDALLESVANHIETAFKESEVLAGRQHGLADVRDKAQFWLDTDRPDLALERSCLHWPLAFPEVSVGIREMFAKMDVEVAKSFGWNDIDLDHGFHPTKQGVRFTISPAARQEVLDRLLELNHQRYSPASVQERIYAREPGGSEASMAGFLIYTAASDSEGTLGGLVALGETQSLGRLLSQALDRCGLCSADPLCAEHVPDKSEDALHNASCHACLFVPETTCERGNRYLDRATLVRTLSAEQIEFFTL